MQKFDRSESGAANGLRESYLLEQEQSKSGVERYVDPCQTSAVARAAHVYSEVMENEDPAWKAQSVGAQRGIATIATAALEAHAQATWNQSPDGDKKDFKMLVSDVLDNKNLPDIINKYRDNLGDELNQDKKGPALG